MKKPNFFIIGAPKCGTTALSYWLSQHPEIYLSPRKEPHFFNKDGLTATSSLSEYESLFSGATHDHIAVGEGSTHYLYSSVAAKNILQYQPSARFIVCLRNPVDMAPSLHSERLSQGRETVKKFSTAWYLQEARAAGQHIPRLVASDPERLQYGAYCKLGGQLNRLYQSVPRESVFTILLDDIRSQPQIEYMRVLDFLGVSKIEPDFEFYSVNSAKHTGSSTVSELIRALSILKRKTGIRHSMGVARFLKSKNVTEKPREPISKEIHAELRKYFQSDIELLSNLLERDLSGWLNDQ